MKNRLTVFILLAGFICTGINYRAYGRDWRRDRDWPYRGRYFDINYRGMNYFYHNGLFFRRGGHGFIIVAPPIGAIVPILPFGYISFTFGPGINYYCSDGVYYRHVPEGYVVVPENEFQEYKSQKEAVKTRELSRSRSDYFIINVPNPDGSFTPVKLIKSGVGYIGPQGEFYPEHPTVEQLRVLYGK